ncbi:MAG TPA: hypothetical protein VJM31_02270 [Vicinamibacterales bacterium]|nr:hypothetical protein [Vicinamibacterales bacterium]
MRHTDMVNTLEQMVDDTCADSVINALAAVCAKKTQLITVDEEDAALWAVLAEHLAAVPNLGV